MSGKMIEITCKCGCGRKKKVRLADRKRGWGLYFSKSCKAKDQERKTGQYKNYLNRNSTEWEAFDDEIEETDLSWDAHKLCSGSAFK